MRISDWSSDVCSSDLVDLFGGDDQRRAHDQAVADAAHHQPVRDAGFARHRAGGSLGAAEASPRFLVGDDLDRAKQPDRARFADERMIRSEEHTSELQSLMSTSYAVSSLAKKKIET